MSKDISLEEQYRDALFERDWADLAQLLHGLDEEAKTNIEVIWLKGFNAGIEVSRYIVNTSNV